MKYIVIIIMAMGICTSIQAIAQQKSGPSFFYHPSSILESADPLLIIEDDHNHIEITQEEFEEINKNSIQSISVLKDDKALEAYGEKGRHGVIILVMKGDSFSETFPGNTQPAKEK